MVVLDSTFLSDFLKRRKAALSAYDRLDESGDTVRIPAAVWVEVLHAFAPAKRAAVARELEGGALFVDFTRELADEAARLQHELRREGAPLGWHDLQIATTALHFREPVLSNDESFDAVPGLLRIGH